MDCGKYTWQQVRDVLVLPAVQAEETRMESVCAWFEGTCLAVIIVGFVSDDDINISTC